MKYNEFVGQVQNRARLTSRDDAVRAIHATLDTLADRLMAGESADLSAHIPPEIAYYLRPQPWRVPEHLSLSEFYGKIAERERVDRSSAVYHARVVIGVLSEAVPPGEMEHVRSQLPQEFDPLFEPAGRGHTLFH